MLKPSINYSVNLLKRNFRMQCMYLYVHVYMHMPPNVHGNHFSKYF